MTSTNQDDAPASPVKNPWRRRLLIGSATFVLAVGLGVAGLVFWPDHQPSPATPTDTGRSVQPIDDADQQARGLAAGVWEDDYQGKRTLTLREDGTGEMVVELSGVKAALFAKRMVFEQTWSLEDDHVTLTATGVGQPQAIIRLILKTMGNVSRERILKLDEQDMHLRNEDGETFEWRRVSDVPEANDRASDTES